MSIRDMVDSIMTDEEGEEVQAEGTAGTDDLGGDFGGGGLGGDDGGGDLGGGDGGDDLGGLGDLDDGGDDLGGFDDEGFDEMGGGEEMAAGGGNVDELEHRLDELENEVGSLSSTVNTVRNENEQISESVEEVEENVRKLLDIYEMVTRGVNPFADEVDAGMGMGGEMEGEGSFGLFTDEEDDQSGESVDEDITDADAEGFFDDDLVEEDDGEEFADAEETFEEDDGGDSGGGTSFEDLKDEYESGDAEWAEGEDGEGADEFEEFGDDTEDDEFEEFGDDLEDDELFEDEPMETDAESATDDEAFDTGGQALETEAEAASEPVVEDAAATNGEAQLAADQAQANTTATTTSADASTSSGKPYVARLPEGFASDLIVVEWLEFLVSHAGVHETTKALDYYESVGWISEEVADEMGSYLRGFQDRSRGSLTIEHHKQSLDYINQLNGGVSVEARTERITPR